MLTVQCDVFVSEVAKACCSCTCYCHEPKETKTRRTHADGMHCVHLAHPFLASISIITALGVNSIILTVFFLHHRSMYRITSVLVHNHSIFGIHSLFPSTPCIAPILLEFIDTHTCLISIWCTVCARDAEGAVVAEIGALNRAVHERKGTTAHRKAQLNHEYITELAEFLSDHKEFSSAELQGRISGSLQWRQQRGEHS